MRKLKVISNSRRKAIRERNVFHFDTFYKQARDPRRPKRGKSRRRK